MKTFIRCLACGAKPDFYGEVDGYKIYKCKHCGLGVTENKVLPDYTDYHRDETYLKENSQFKNIFLKRVRIIADFVKPGRALEVGSSTGALLRLLREEGWTVLGIEPSVKARAYAVKHGIPTLGATFKKAKIKDNFFDAVIFNHVLEHVDNPIKTLEKTFKVMKKGGVVLIDVPNFASFRSKLSRTRWGYLYPAEHKWHFTRDSLERLLIKCGFEVIHAETRSGVWDYGNPLREIWESFGRRRFFSNVITIVPTLFLSKIGLGSGLTIIGRKK